MKKILGKWNSRWSVLLLLLFFGPLANAPFAIANDIRLVPQVSLTNIAPISVAYHPDDDNIVMLRNDNGRIDILDITDWSNPFKKLEIQGGIRAVAFSPDGKRIVSGGFDGKVRFWDAEFGTPVGQPLEGHKGVVSSVAFSPDGKRIASGDEDGVVRLWDAETGRINGRSTDGSRELGIPNSLRRELLCAKSLVAMISASESWAKGERRATLRPSRDGASGLSAKLMDWLAQSCPRENV